MLRSALKFGAGAAIAIVVWTWTIPTYNQILAVVAEPVMRIDPRLRHGEIQGADRKVNARGSETQPDLPRVIIPADQLTYNVILLIGLFATNPRPFRDRGVLRLALALLVLFATHVLALVISIESTYATRLGPWSNAHYGPLEQDVWTAIEFAYRLAGMFAIAFACWWLTVSGSSADRKSPARSAA